MSEADKKQAVAEEQKDCEREGQSLPLARFKLLYESNDRRMCLFEDEQGHLVAAPSSRLA